MRIPLLTLTLTLGLAASAVLASSASATSCMAPGKRLVEVTRATNLSCLKARVDIDAFTDPYAVSFRTPGSFVCSRTSELPRDTAFRCVKGRRSYRFHRYGVIPAGIRVFGSGYDKTFRVTRCTNQGESDLILRGRAGSFRVRIDAAPGPAGTLRLTGGDEEDGLDARGTVSDVRVGDAGSIQARGRFTSGLTGSFRIRGDCA